MTEVERENGKAGVGELDLRAQEGPAGVEVASVHGVIPAADELGGGRHSVLLGSHMIRWMRFPGSLTLTFDNLGEAAELERGTWDAASQRHPHPSLAALPRVLALLAELRLPATFFVEAINVEAHPTAVGSIASAGYEVGCHGWRHETWSALTPDDEARVLRRSTAALRGLGLEVAGFRPPGGRLNAGTPARLADAGIAYCSPAGWRAGRRRGLAYVPFAWPLVDAYWYAPELWPLRVADGLQRAPLPPARFRRAACGGVDALARGGGHGCLVLHPFLAHEDEAFAALADVLDHVAALSARGELRVVRGRDAAAALLAGDGAAEPQLDDASWTGG